MEELQGHETSPQGQDTTEQHHLEGVAHAMLVSSRSQAYHLSYAFKYIIIKFIFIYGF